MKHPRFRFVGLVALIVTSAFVLASLDLPRPQSRQPASTPAIGPPSGRPHRADEDILIDGDFTDWVGLPATLVDGNETDFLDARDIKTLTRAQNAKHAASPARTTGRP